MVSSKFDVVVVGSCNIDLISYVSRFPKAGETICGSKFTTGCGGKGANQCVMAAKLGATTAMIGCVGDDSFGAMYRDNFASLSVDTNHLHTIVNMTTGVAPITVTDDGENSIVIVKGANDCLTHKHLEDSAEVIASAGIVLCQLEIDLEITLAALKMARSKGVDTLFNTAPAVEGLSDEYLQNSTILCCNETEAELLTGMSLGDGSEQRRRVVEVLLSKGPEYVVITLGSEGAVFGCKADSTVTHVRPDSGQVTKVVDTTGAGDCFVGSLAYFVAKKPGMGFEEKVRRAVAIASRSVEKPGTQISYPTYKELPACIME